MTEVQKYSVLEVKNGFEIRDYEPHILLTTIEPGNMNSAGNRAFSKLAGFIFGGNSKDQKIAMTAPVLEVPGTNGYAVSFVMPSDMKLEDMPEANPGLTITQMPASQYAAIQFSGMATDELFSRKEKALREALQKANLSSSGAAEYARYNGPWTPFFMRRNEVLIPLPEPIAP